MKSILILVVLDLIYMLITKDENYSEYYPKFKIKAKALIEKNSSFDKFVNRNNA